MHIRPLPTLVTALVVAGVFQRCSCSSPIERAYLEDALDQAQMVAIVTAQSVEVCPGMGCLDAPPAFLSFNVEDVLLGNFMAPQRLYTGETPRLSDALRWFNDGRPVQMLLATYFVHVPPSLDGGTLTWCGVSTGETLHDRMAGNASTTVWWLSEDGTRVIDEGCVLSKFRFSNTSGPDAQQQLNRDKYCSYSRAAAMEEIDLSRARVPARTGTTQAWMGPGLWSGQRCESLADGGVADGG